MNRNTLIKSTLTITAMFTLLGCGNGNHNIEKPNPGNDNSTPSALPQEIDDAIQSPHSSLTQELKDSIAYMYSEESLAHDIYLEIYTIQPLKQLKNIANNSETKHIEAVNAMAVKYDLNMTQYPDTDIPYSINGIEVGNYPVDNVQYLYDLLYSKGIASEKEALEVGCMVEVVDIDDLDTYIVQAETSNAPDVLDIFNFLRNGSYTHYWAFDKGLKNRDVAEGCCSVPPALGHNFCHPEYPKK